MANRQQEYPLVLLGILEELAHMRHSLSFQDLCRMVSTRFDLEHLVELRSLLFAAASRDPCFPATLFRDRVTTRGLGLSPIGVAADIVTIFNLIQMTGGAPDDQPASQPMRAQTIDRSSGIVLPRVDLLSLSGRERARAHAHVDPGGRTIDQHFLYPKSNYSAGRKRGSLPPDPISLLAAPPVSRARAVSFDWPNNAPLFPGGQLPSATMQNIYLPLETDSESSADSATMEVFEPEHGSVVGQRRSVFKKDFHNQPPLVPQVTVSSESPSPDTERKPFDRHGFELLANPYPSPAPYHSPPEQRAKHESPDDLQDSTYFGPGSITDRSSRHLQPPRNQKSIWSNKSHSLEDRIGQSSLGMGMEVGGLLPRRSSPAISHFLEGDGGSIVDRMRAMATQTDPPDHRRLRSLVHADRLSFMTSLDDPEFGEDDISAIFRFLDEVSMCGSTGVLHPNDGAASISQDTPEARRGRLGQLQRLFHSLESSDDGVKASVYKLLLRMSQIERQLESLTEVKAEISQVLSALQRLDDKIPQPVADGVGGHVGGHADDRWLEPLSAGGSSFSSHPLTPASESSDPQPLSVSGHLFSAGGTGSLDWNRWNTGGGQATDGGKAHGHAKAGKEGKKGGASRRVSKTQSEEKGGLDSKRSSVSHSARDWAVSFSKNKGSKDSSAGKMGKMDQSNSTTNLLSAQRPPNLMEQVFNSALFRQTESSLTGGMTSGKIIDPRMPEGRTRPVWTVDESQSRIASLDLHAQESLNPNNMEFWMEDIYTPGYDALLRRKEADQRRAKFCKLAALIAIAIAIILIIVIPICTMGS